jgi:hypothetical protein
VSFPDESLVLSDAKPNYKFCGAITIADDSDFESDDS